MIFKVLIVHLVIAALSFALTKFLVGISLITTLSLTTSHLALWCYSYSYEHRAPETLSSREYLCSIADHFLSFFVGGYCYWIFIFVAFWALIKLFSVILNFEFQLEWMLVLVWVPVLVQGLFGKTQVTLTLPPRT